MTGETCRIYESSFLRQVTGETIRPGGFNLTDRAVNICGFCPKDKVLDLGCGTGATVEYLTTKYSLQVAGIDPSDHLLDIARKQRPELPFIQALAESLPFMPGEMDGIFAECTISVMANPDKALQECNRVLKNKGWLVITDVYARNPEAVGDLRSLPTVSCLTGAMSRNELEEKLLYAGFRIVLWEDHSNVLKELMIKFIMTHGSMANFWQQSTTGSSDGIDTHHMQEVIKKARPGYFLLIAKKDS